MVDEDRNVIRQLNVPKNMHDEWERELALKLAGKTGDDKQDDQLFGAAANLSPAEWKSYM